MTPVNSGNSSQHTAALHPPTDSVQERITHYIKERDLFNRQGGESFMDKRRTIRAAYCDATVSTESLESWIKNIANSSVQEEFHNRFQEWNDKIRKGLLQKTQTPTVSEKEFFERLQNYYDQHSSFLEGPAFANFTKAKNALREVMLPKLQKTQAAGVIEELAITDPELQARITTEWAFKARS